MCIRDRRVEVRCRGGDQWFTGKITAVRDGCWYDILYDDGESEARVAVSRIRRWVSTPHTGAPASARPSADAARDEAARREAARAREAAAERARAATLEHARAARAAATTVQPGHSSPPSHAFPFPDARSFAGDFCTIFPCIPFVPLACEKIIPHDSNSYQSKGMAIMMLGYIPIPFCWDVHLARVAGNTFGVDTPGCHQGNTATWTSANGFCASDSCCPSFRCG